MSLPIRKILHIDMDAFYASVEQRDNPALRGLPIAVGSGEARGVVCAASYEARKFGVRSAMPSVTAKRLCPALTFVRTRFDVYRAVSEQIHRIFADYTDLIQPLSLDEAYLDVTEDRCNLGSAWATAKEIRRRILEETGLTASAGVSYNKFLAKIASDHRKPNGQFAVTPDMGAGWVATLPVSKFHGIGPVTTAKMKRLGIETGADLYDKPLAFLETHFGSAAEWYYNIARGIDERPVNPHRDRKSSGSERTFREDLTQGDEVELATRRMADEVWHWCAEKQTFGSTVTVKVKYHDFEQVTRRRTIEGQVTTQAMLHDLSLGLVRSLLPLAKPVRLIGVTVSSFKREGARQPPRAHASRPEQYQLALAS